MAENGAVIYDPATGQEHVIAAAAPIRFVEKLMERKVEPISVGRSIVATWEPHQATVLNVIQELGLELQIIFNKGTFMVLPPGVNKASGLAVALAELDIAVHNVVGIQRETTIGWSMLSVSAMPRNRQRSKKYGDFSAKPD